jgi:hypothetical protein
MDETPAEPRGPDEDRRGRPAEGALNSAVMASPVSSTWAGQPSAAARWAMSATWRGR